MTTRQAQEPHALRRADHRLDDRARGAACPRTAPLIAAVIYNRLKQGIPLGIDATMRYAAEQLDAAPLTQSRAASSTRRTTRAPARACRRRRSATPAWPRCEAAAQPGARRRTSTTSSSRAATARTPSRRPTRSSSRTCGLRRKRARSSAARPVALLEVADAAPRRPRLAGRPQPLAGDAQRRARARSGCGDWRYQLLPVPPELLRRDRARAAGAGLPGANVTIPHKEAALALADERDRAARARSARRTR